MVTDASAAAAATPLPWEVGEHASVPAWPQGGDWAQDARRGGERRGIWRCASLTN